MRSKANQVTALKDQKSEISSQWSRIRLWLALCTMLLPLDSTAEAQQPKVYRIGALVPGSAWYEIIDGLRVGLKEVGLEEGKQYSLQTQDWKGDAKAGERAASILPKKMLI